MRALQRTTLIAILTLAPVIQTGCVSWPSRVAQSRAIEQRQLKMNTARQEESRGHLDVSKSLYEEILRQNPLDAECLHRLAVVCTRLNQYDEAEVYYLQANAMRPNDPEILADMGYTAFLRKKYAESETFFEQSVKLRDGDRQTITNLAIVRAWQRQDDSSLATFRRVNGESEALRNLAAIQVARGDNEDAKKSYELAKFADATLPTYAPAIAQTTANDVTRQQMADAPPPPAPLTQSALFSSQPAMEPIAPLPPLPVISPYQHEAIAVKMIPATSAVRAISASRIDANTATPMMSCTATAIPAIPAVPPSPLPYDSAPQLSIPLNAPAPVKDDDSTSVPLSGNLTVSANPIEADPPSPRLPETETRIQLDEEFMYEPIIAPESTLDSRPADSQLKLDPCPPTIWRKTPASRAGSSIDTPLLLKELPIRKETSNLGDDGEDSNVWSICLVTLLEEQRVVGGRAEFSMEYESQQYRFSSSAALEKFRAAPRLYAPAAGGLDVVAVRNERNVVRGSLNFALWQQRQLYLFSSSEHAEEFRRHPQKYVPANLTQQ